MSAWVKVGAKCVCVSDFGGSTQWYIPKRLKVYTVAAVDPNHQFGVCVELAEISAPLARYKFEAVAFRPLAYPKQDQSHDIALFTPYLTPERRPASRPVSASAASIAPTAKSALSALSGEGA